MSKRDMKHAKIKITALTILGLALGGCASKQPLSSSTYVPPDQIVAVKGILRHAKNYDVCRDQPVEETVAQFHSAAEQKCSGDKECEESTYNKLVNGEYSLSKAAKGAADGSAIGLIPLAAGSSTASWGRVSLAGAILGLLSTSRGPSLEKCTQNPPQLFNENNERISFVCGGWDHLSKKLPREGNYTDEERVELLLGGAFDKRYINLSDDIVVVNTRKIGTFVVRPCSIMTEEEFEFVQKHFPVKLSEPTLYVKKEQ